MSVLTIMSVREQIKARLAMENISLTEIASKMTEKTGKNYSMHNLSQKLTSKTLKFEEASLIAEILNYEIKFEKK